MCLKNVITVSRNVIPHLQFSFVQKQNHENLLFFAFYCAIPIV